VSAGKVEGALGGEDLTQKLSKLEPTAGTAYYTIIGNGELPTFNINRISKISSQKERNGEFLGGMQCSTSSTLRMQPFSARATTSRVEDATSLMPGREYAIREVSGHFVIQFGIDELLAANSNCTLQMKNQRSGPFDCSSLYPAHATLRPISSHNVIVLTT
jgi:hypothetical protein